MDHAKLNQWINRALVVAVLAVGGVAVALAASGMQDVKETLFKEASKNLKQAREMKADVLAPKSFGEGLKYYREAEADFQRGKNLDGIRKKLQASVRLLQKAMEATKLAEVTFSASMKARADALAAGAPSFASQLWREADGKFAEAATELENGDVNSAKRKSVEGERLFRQAELAAIKANYLNETWTLLDQAEKSEVKKYAPKTLARAQDLIAKAENELNTNRYDTDVARDLARQAKYEAKHALFLANVIRQLKDNKISWEDYILATEKPLANIASSVDIVGEFDSGFNKTTEAILAWVKTYQDSAMRLTQELAERDQQIEMLSARVSELQEKLGGVEKEKSALARRMEAQARIRQQFASVEKIFSREEAQVLREGNDIIIRLVGLNFAVGKAAIEPQYFGLLTRLQQAVNTFPECTVTVEGHTDSFGSNESNQKLSQERAEAVRQYILANMGLEESRISAVGYGESRPIANNETPEGRTKNRRIDVVIHPSIQGTN